MRIDRPRIAVAAFVAALVCAAPCAADPVSDSAARRLNPPAPASAPADGAASEKSADAADLAQPVDPWSPRETEAVAFANELTLRARAIFADPGLDQAERRSAFRALVSEVFDVDALGKALLGNNKGRFTERQMKSYESVVPDYLVKLYASRIYNVCSTNPAVVSVEEQARGVFVRTAYGRDPGVRPVLVDWLLNPRPDGSWRVLDMAVNGVSLAQAKMEEFDAVLAMQSPDAFLELLHAQAGQALPNPLASPIAPEAPPRPRGF